jgi:hypothetical protein
MGHARPVQGVPGGQGRRRRRAYRRTGPAGQQQALQAGGQLGAVERLGQVVVRAGLQRGEHAVVVHVRGHEHDRQRRGGRAVAQPPAEVDTGLVRHAHVEQQRVDRTAVDQGLRGTGVLRLQDVVAELAQGDRHQFTVIGIVVGYQHGRHASLLTLAPPPVRHTRPDH